MKKKVFSFLAALLLISTISVFVFADEYIYDDNHQNSPYNYARITGPNNNKTGTVYIKSSYVDNGYRCYRGAIRYRYYNKLTGSFSWSPYSYTAYGTGPSDSSTHTASLSVSTTLLNTNVYTIYYDALFFWTPANSTYWPVSHEEIS